MSDKIENTPAQSADAPSFDPGQLEALRGTRYELIPLHGKAPAMRGWRTLAPLDLDEAMRRLDEGIGNIGVRLLDGDLVVDVDPRNFSGGDSLSRLQADLGIDFSAYPTVETGSGGQHIYMTIEPGTQVVNALDAYPGVEFKAHGRQVVAPGSVHPATGMPYRHDPLSGDLAQPKVAPDALVQAVRRPAAVPSTEPGDCSPEQLADMLDGLDPADFADYDRWFEVLAASHHATAGLGLEEFVTWSTSDPCYSDHERRIAAHWNSLHAGRGGREITQRTLFKRLLDAGREDLIPRADPADDFPDDLEDLTSFLQDAPKTTLLDRINSNRFTVLSGGKYLVGREWFDERMQRHVVDWFPDEAMRKHMNIKKMPRADGKHEGLGDWWLRHQQRRQYDRVVFDPSPAATSAEVYNMWRGWAVEPTKGDWSLLQRLVREVLCCGDETSYDYVMRWAAFMVQHPNTPAEVALVFKGPKGVGKGTFGRELKAIAGQHGRQVAQPEHFTGRFNEHLADTILLFVDEGLWAGDKKVEGVLKNLITEPTLSFEGKNKPIIEGPNHLHVVIASNEDWVIPATPDERRFAVFEADADAKAKLPAGFFSDLNEQMGAGGRAGMLQDLLAMDLAGWHPRKDIPQTEALAAQKVEGFRSEPMAFWWHRCLDDGRIGFIGEIEGWSEPFDADSTLKDQMVASVNAQARLMGKRAEYTKTKLARFLGKVGVDVGARDRRGSKVYAVPALHDARKAFEGWVGRRSTGLSSPVAHFDTFDIAAGRFADGKCLVGSSACTLLTVLTLVQRKSAGGAERRRAGPVYSAAIWSPVPSWRHCLLSNFQSVESVKSVQRYGLYRKKPDASDALSVVSDTSALRQSPWSMPIIPDGLALHPENARARGPAL